MACIEDYAPRCENSPTSAQPQNLSGLWYQMLSKFLPWGDVETSSQIPHPTIISPSEPDGLQGRGAFDYMKGLEDHWITPSLSTHLWILSNVLVRGDQLNHDRHISPSELSKCLTRYIAAMSFKQIARRFNNTDLSRCYIECLKQVKEIPIMSQPRKDQSVHYHRYQIEINSDRLFLKDFVMLSNKDYDLIRTHIPNILKLANNLPSKDKDFELYTDETSTEFHNLLLEILDHFKSTLDTLMAFDKDEAARDSGRHDIFNKNVHNVHVYGYALLRLCMGQYFTLPLLVQRTPTDFHRTLPFPMDSVDSPSEDRRSPLDMTGFRCKSRQSPVKVHSNYLEARNGWTGRNSVSVGRPLDFRRISNRQRQKPS
ncbi:uncharacterized protein LACBIDRAFT_331731 [Laccaria bicolor S238N-H82]|uniref:Predicted protein n=1 Tax=Laccaria bicolor (strain S238N-H82 / ATCC MYA-4686) TaxID=486041 RepID=B0DQD5_LACBS|nr:uncharacterized protein LACBIDRAFT_331731 [Laccaria bicolor S238N-H82]EDR03277.1 predicted protein [Laccaria bicolor S238N-H82]|eukprot:XP_001886073.1 predicted protein [Laccaria bicolor S238N-H82]